MKTNFLERFISANLISFPEDSKLRLQYKLHRRNQVFTFSVAAILKITNLRMYLRPFDKIKDYELHTFYLSERTTSHVVSRKLFIRDDTFEGGTCKNCRFGVLCK